MGPSTDAMSIISLITGILGCLTTCCCSIFGVPFPLAALILGILSMGRINREPDRFTGKGLAIAGIVLGAVGLLLVVMNIIFGIGSVLMEQAGVNRPNF